VGLLTVVHGIAVMATLNQLPGNRRLCTESPSRQAAVHPMADQERVKGIEQ
jgi:hypothetical protein